MKKRLALSAVPLALFALTGCSGADLTSSSGDVSDERAEEFLSDLEDEWRKYRESDSLANISDDATCFLGAKESDGELKATEEAFCGPIAILGGADSERWDTFSTNIVKKGGEAAFDDDFLEGDALSYLTGSYAAERPEKVAFYRPDGTEAPSADAAEALEPPKAPPAEPGYLDTYDESLYGPVEGMETVSGFLTSPVYDLNLTGLGTVETIGEGQEALSAAEGERLAAIRFDISTNEDGENYDSNCGYFDDCASDDLFGTTEFFIVAGETRTPIGDFVYTDSGEQTLVASVPEGAELVMRVDGVDQSMSLDTAERTSIGVADAYYTEANEVLLSEKVQMGAYRNRDIDFKYGANLDNVRLSPYSQTRGWADDGQAWLTFEMVHNTDDDADSHYVTMRSEPSFDLVIDGETIETDSKFVDYYPEDGETYFVRFAVPADTTQATFKVTPTFGFEPDFFADPDRFVTGSTGSTSFDITLG